MNYLIADSGSTKTSWLLIDEEGRRTEYETLGINPVRDSEEVMEQSLRQISSLLPPSASLSPKPASMWPVTCSGLLMPCADMRKA